MLKDDLTDCRTNKTLKGLSPLLQSWLAIVKRSVVADGYWDVPWWYNERATLSTLAGAAWKLDTWSALEEFSTKKRGVMPDKKVDPGRLVGGRCDLYVSHPTSDFAFEAKQAWQPMLASDPTLHLTRAMVGALKDAGDLTAGMGTHRLGLVFVVPNIPVDKVATGYRKGGKPIIDRALARAAVEAWLAHVDLSAFDAHAYIFPARCNEFYNDKKRFFPGVVVLIKRKPRGNKRKLRKKRVLAA